MLHRPLPPAAGKVFLATPVRDKPEPGYAYALALSVLALHRAGIEAEPAMLVGDPHVDDARNRLVRQFLAGDCETFVFLDADLRWEPPDLIRLIKTPGAIVGGLYPMKQEEEAYPIAEWRGIYQLPTGFLKIERHVLERLADLAPKFRGKREGAALIPVIFERTLDDVDRVGGDYGLCRKAHELLGIEPVLIPDFYLHHTGPYTWSGSWEFFKRTQESDVITAAIDAIRDRKETNETLQRLVKAWGNDVYSAAGDFLGAAVMLARAADGPVLDCGSGLTTLVMAAANPNVKIYSLESSKRWVQKIDAEATRQGLKNIEFCCGSLKGGWYQMPPDWPRDYALAVVDGPRRIDGHRGGAVDLCAKVFLFDDVDDPNIRWLAEETARARGIELAILGQPMRPIGVVYEGRRREAA